MGRSLGGERQAAALERMEEEIANIHAGWEWTVSHRRVSVLAEYVRPLHAFYQVRGWCRQGEIAFGKAAATLRESSELAEQPDARAVLATILARQGSLRLALGDLRGAALA